MQEIINMSYSSNQRLILDKNAIQGLNPQELNSLLNNNSIIIPQSLQIECLGNLTKKCPDYEKKLSQMKNKNGRIGISKEEFTAMLFKKINIFPLAQYSNMDFIKMELFENIQIKMTHNFFDYKNFASTSINYIDIFDHIDTREQVERWAKMEFNKEDENMAKDYNFGRENKIKEFESINFHSYQLQDIIEMTKILHPPENRILVAYIKDTITRLFNDPDEIQANIRSIIEKMKQLPLSEFAPYTAYVFTIDHWFHNSFLPMWLMNRPSKIGSDWIDVNYCYYFPFIDSFVTKDQFFIKEITKILSPAKIPQGFFRSWESHKNNSLTS